MSVVAVIRQMLAAGMPLEHALTAAEIMEATPAPKSKGAERQRRWRERLETSRKTPETVETLGDPGDVRDASPLPLPPSPQTPQPPTPSPGESTTRAREPTSDQLSRVAVLRQAFEGFWADYPRKKAKPDAERAYAKALGRIGGPDAPGVILTGLRRQLDGWATGPPEYVPHPATWLNRDGWNDEADEPRTLRQGARHDHPRPSSGLDKIADVFGALREGARDVELFGTAADAQPH